MHQDECKNIFNILHETDVWRLKLLDNILQLVPSKSLNISTLTELN